MESAQLPEDVTGPAVDLEDGGVVACGYEVVALIVLVDAVDVEVVPGIGRVASSTVMRVTFTKGEGAV